MNFSGWKSMESRFRAYPILVRGEAMTPGNIEGYKHAGNCLILSYRMQNVLSPLEGLHEEDASFLLKFFGHTLSEVFMNVVNRPYFQLIGTGVFPKIINYHLAQYSKKERALHKAKKDTSAHEPQAAISSEDAMYQDEHSIPEESDASIRLRQAKIDILETIASRSSAYLDRPLSISPRAVEASLRYCVYKNTAMQREFFLFSRSGSRNKAELSEYSKILRSSYIHGSRYAFIPFDARSVYYTDGKVFLPMRVSVPKQCRLGLSFDLNNYSMPAELNAEYDLRPSRYHLTLDPIGEKGFYVQLVYWFKGDKMKLYRKLYSEGVPGVNFFHYIPDVSVGL